MPSGASVRYMRQVADLFDIDTVDQTKSPAHNVYENKIRKRDSHPRITVEQANEIYQTTQLRCIDAQLEMNHPQRRTSLISNELDELSVNNKPRRRKEERNEVALKKLFIKSKQVLNPIVEKATRYKQLNSVYTTSNTLSQ